MGATAKGWVFGVLALFAGVAAGAAEPGDGAVRLREQFPVGYQYHVQARVELSGTLTVPGAKDKPARSVGVRGESALDYDERVLAAGADETVTKTLRIARRMDFRRTVADQPQATSLRPAVRRLVLLRHKSSEVPFSPDGPLTWGEIDQVRTDVFTPALAGLLPTRPVRPGDRWTASTAAVQELTDFEKIESGNLECKLDKVGDGRARVEFAGTVKGTNEDGPGRQQLTGYFLFDLGGNYLSYLHLNGAHSLLDNDKEVGRVEGRFVLTRRANTTCDELADAAVNRVSAEPNAENTRLLYDNPDLGVKFVYPRRWRVSGVRGSQVSLDGADGSGLLLTLDPVDKVPTGGQFLAESRAWLEKQKAELLRVTIPERVRKTPALDRFAIEAEMAGQKFGMEYYVTRQAGGGATLAARLEGKAPAEERELLRKEVEHLARSVEITKTISDKR